MPSSDTLCWNQSAIIKVSYQSEEISMGFDCGHTDTMLDNTWKERIENITETVNLITEIGSEKEETVFVANELVVKISGINVLLKNIDVLERSSFDAPKEAMIELFGADIICGRKWSIGFMLMKRQSQIVYITIYLTIIGMMGLHFRISLFVIQIVSLLRRFPPFGWLTEQGILKIKMNFYQ